MARGRRLRIVVAMVQLPEILLSSMWNLDDLDTLAVAIVALTARAIFEVAGELTLLQWRALVELSATGPLRLGDLAVRLPSSMPATSRLAKRMTERGLLMTGPVATDGRGISVQLSGEGRMLHTAVIDRRRKLIADRIGSSPMPSGLVDGLHILGQRLGARSLTSVKA